MKSQCSAAAHSPQFPFRSPSAHGHGSREQRHPTPNAPAWGVFGGSFDPPHYGHLALAETARVQLTLARVLFVPAGRPPHKQAHELSSSEDRAAMVRAAIEDNVAFELSRVDLDRPGPHYTVDTLALLRTAYPQVSRWYFLMGEDSLQDLPSWYDVEGILAQASLAVMPRSLALLNHNQHDDALPDDALPDDALPDDGLQERVPQLAERLIWLDVPPVNYSSTVLRNRTRAGLPLRYLTPSKVVAYIHKRSLYK